MLLTFVVMIAAGLITAKLLLDRRKRMNAPNRFDAPRREQFMAEVDKMLRTIIPTTATFVDPAGQLALSMTKAGDAIVIFHPAERDWSPEFSKPTVRSTLVPVRKMVWAEVHDTIAHRTTKRNQPTAFVTAVEFHLTVDDLENPVHICNFLEKETPAGSHAHRSARKQAYEWKARVEVLNFRANGEQALRADSVGSAGRAPVAGAPTFNVPRAT